MLFYYAVAEKPEDGFHLDLEDYLMGILTLASELVRVMLLSGIIDNYSIDFVLVF